MKQVYDQVQWQAYKRSGNQVYWQVFRQVIGQVIGQVERQVDRQVWEQVNSQVRGQALEDFKKDPLGIMDLKRPY